MAYSDAHSRPVSGQTPQMLYLQYVTRSGYNLKITAVCAREELGSLGQWDLSLGE